MPNLDPLIEQLRQAFGVGVEQQVALQLLEFLSKNPGTTHITLQLVRKIAGTKQSEDVSVVRTLQYLAGDAGVLATRFEYIDDDDRPHDLSDDEAKDVMQYGVNPVTGDNDPRARERLAVYFSPTERVSAIVKSGGFGGNLP